MRLRYENIQLREIQLNTLGFLELMTSTIVFAVQGGFILGSKTQKNFRNQRISINQEQILRHKEEVVLPWHHFPIKGCWSNSREYSRLIEKHFTFPKNQHL